MGIFFMRTGLLRVACAMRSLANFLIPGLLSVCLLSTLVSAQPVVPGMGIIIDEVGDDFEQPRWEYMPNHPKSSRNIDKKERGPLGTSLNASLTQSGV